MNSRVHAASSSQTASFHNPTDHGRSSNFLYPDTYSRIPSKRKNQNSELQTLLRSLKYLPILFCGVLIVFLNILGPKPYSNYKGPSIRPLQIPAVEACLTIPSPHEDPASAASRDEADDNFTMKQIEDALTGVGA